jgi:HEAT repeat protein
MAIFGPNIKKLEENGDIEELSKSLRHKRDIIRENAASALERLAWKPHDDANKAWYYAAIRSWQELEQMGELALAPLVLALQHSEEAVKLAAGNTLEQVVISNADSAVPFLCEALCNQFVDLNPKTRQARNCIVKILGKAGDARAVIPLIQNVDKIQTMEFNRQASVHPSKKTFPETHIYQNLVEQAIKDIGESAIIPLVEAHSKHIIYSFDLSRYLSWIKIPTPDPLIILLDHENANVRSAALSALGQIDDNRIVPLLMKYLSDGNEDERIAALGSLEGKVSDSYYINLLAKALRDKYLRMRTISAAGLRKRNLQPPNLEEKVYFLLAEYLASNTLEGYYSLEKKNEFLALGLQAINPLVSSLNLEGKLWQHGYSVAYGLKVPATENDARNVIGSLLIEIGKPSIPALERALDDHDPIIRKMAEVVLKNIKK